MRFAVVGHVEWVQFARVAEVPAAGEVVHASETWEQAAGGGAVAAVQLAKLAGEATLFTALGDDELGHRALDELTAHGVRVEAVFGERRQRRAFTLIDATGERTISVLDERLVPSGEDPLPWAELAHADGVYFTAGDRGALEAARRGRRLIATARTLLALAEAQIELDALVGSARDAAESYQPGDLRPPPRALVTTDGSAGGTYLCADGHGGAYQAAPLEASIGDAYGCGDSFAAGLTFGLGSDLGIADALALAARCGAACLTGRGAYEGQLRVRD